MGNGSTADNCAFVWIEGVEFYNTGNAEAIDFKPGANRCKARGNNVHDIHPGTSTVNNEGAIVVNGYDYGNFVLTGTQNIWIENNVVNNVSGGTKNRGIVFFGSGVKVKGNTVTNCAKDGIHASNWMNKGYANYLYGNTTSNNNPNVTIQPGITVLTTNPGTNLYNRQTWYQSAGQKRKMRTGILLLGIFASAGAWAADLSTKETTSPTGAEAGNGPTKGTPSRENTRNLSARLDGILSGESSPYPASANGPDLILEWALTDPVGLLNYIVARKDYASVLVATLGSVATSQGEEFVSSLVNRLPESHRGVSIDSAAIAWVNKDPAAAAKWMSPSRNCPAFSQCCRNRRNVRGGRRGSVRDDPVAGIVSGLTHPTSRLHRRLPTDRFVFLG